METRSILCPIDASPCSDEALTHAAALARQSGATLQILRVTEVPTAYSQGVPIYSREAAEVAQDRDALRDLEIPAGTNFEKNHRIGDPATEILKFTAEQQVDLIVMGTHGRRGWGRMLFGSVAEKVVRQAPCPVLTYRASRGTLTADEKDADEKAPDEKAPE